MILCHSGRTIGNLQRLLNNKLKNLGFPNEFRVIFESLKHGF